MISRFMNIDSFKITYFYNCFKIAISKFAFHAIWEIHALYSLHDYMHDTPSYLSLHSWLIRKIILAMTR